MQTPFAKALIVATAAIVAVGTLDAASARQKKKVRAKPPVTSSERWLRESLVPLDRDGTPIIMQGYRSPRMMRDAAGTQPPAQPEVERRAERPVRIPRGSSTYIPPPDPSPYSSNRPPAAALTQPPPAPYQPPKINTFGDRVTNCIHSYPLNAGIGNNPTDQQTYIRQCAN